METGGRKEAPKWRGTVSGIIEAPAEKVWALVSETRRLPEWIPMVERCTDLAGEEGIPGYTRLVSGFMFPQQGGERSWIKERLVSMDSSSIATFIEWKPAILMG
ncbi:Polyketide cyclase/dehydrase [Trema orientale]|uniref:Polyketide cyclase/dehydrase n=1 Tax=Trema orientale TaxID=63057 RepID=A0A2P5ENM6_TREOI|nr:Polyketide cyclase/dehydrase [Trema orientale]